MYAILEKNSTFFVKEENKLLSKMEDFFTENSLINQKNKSG